MILITATEFLGIGKKFLTTELLIFLSSEEISDVESDFCDQMKKIR